MKPTDIKLKFLLMVDGYDHLWINNTHTMYVVALLLLAGAMFASWETSWRGLLAAFAVACIFSYGAYRLGVKLVADKAAKRVR